jgi:endonuclease/exonuclease/phosphatase family metal-dependent hydrolase
VPYYHNIKDIKDKEEQLRIIDKLLLLRRQLDRQIPQKTAADTLLVATWNIREFGDNRRDESIYYLAEIISRFDVVAVQEISANRTGFLKVCNLLKPHWEHKATMSTEGTAGGGERMAFLYDTRKIKLGDLVGAVVLPKTKLIEGELQFARTPFGMAFLAGWFKFTLVAVHIYYGSSSGIDKRRLAEVNAVASMMAKNAKMDNSSYILLGDFNIAKSGDDTMKALENNGFAIPDCIKQHPSDLGGTKHYDQIAFNLKLDNTMTIFSEKEQKAGAFNFAETIYTPQDLEIYRKYFPEQAIKGKTEKEIEKYYLTTWRTFQISDHLPLWVELKINFGNQYLERIKKTMAG